MGKNVTKTLVTFSKKIRQNLQFNKSDNFAQKQVTGKSIKTNAFEGIFLSLPAVAQEKLLELKKEILKNYKKNTFF